MIKILLNLIKIGIIKSHSAKNIKDSNQILLFLLAIPKHPEALFNFKNANFNDQI